MPRRYTVAEANALLPRISPWLEELQGIARRLVAIREALTAIGPARFNGKASEVLRLEAEAEALAPRAEAALRRLTALGVEVKDPATGLIDFRSLRGDREVYLCWRLGEDAIAWWHELDAGFQGRQPL